MMYYVMELDEESKELATIITPYGKYQYCCMAMGLKVSPDVAQAMIESILHDLDVDIYINDMAILSNDYVSHLNLINTVLNRL